MADANAYEEKRRMQVEENRRKLDEMRLHQLSAAVREAAARPKPKRKAPLKKHCAGEDAPLRRSGRLAGLPVTVGSLPSRRHTTQVSDEERAYAITKAEGLANKLGSDHPTFVKPMTHSYVGRSTELYLPGQFSKKYLPENEMFVLVDEADGEFEMFYSMDKCGNHWLGTGWRGFAVDHKLVDGDCLVFQLTERTKFKVYMIRASSYCENDHDH